MTMRRTRSVDNQRVCAAFGCGTRLNQYNTNALCFPCQERGSKGEFETRLRKEPRWAPPKDEAPRARKEDPS